MDRHFVYLFRDEEQRIVYVGRGETTNRPEQGVSGSHNEGLRELVETGRFSLEAAGPYGDLETAEFVEAALISALSVPATPRLKNQVPGHGPKFAPLGVPVELADRMALEPMALAELGRATGGILLVRLAAGRAFSDDELRARFNPADPDDDVIQENIVRSWWIRALLEQWRETGEWPKVIAGVAGPPKRRYIAGALTIDPEGPWAAEGPGYEVPVVPGGGIDACQLRGRQVTGAKFSQIRPGVFIWVDGTGIIRHEPPRPGAGTA